MQSFQNFKHEKIKEILENNHYLNSNLFSAQFRYSIITDPDLTIIFGVKIPIEIPISFHLPVELVSFHISIAIRPFWLDDATLSLIDSFSAQFRNLVENTLFKTKIYNFEFHYEDYEEKIISLLKKYYPEPSIEIVNPAVPEDYLTNLKIRNSYLQKYKDLEKLNEQFSQDILEISNDFHLHPTQNLPPELIHGIPAKRHSQLIMFTRQNPSQYLIEEPGSISYYRDYTLHNVWIRTGFESLSAPIWYQVFEDQKFRMDYLIYDWMVYTRGLLRAILPLFDTNTTDYIQRWKNFSEVAFLNKISHDSSIPGLFLPSLFYESSYSFKLIKPEYDLLDAIPCSLVELYAEIKYNHAKSLLKKGHFQESINELSGIMAILNKYHHQKGSIKVQIELASLENSQQNYSNALKILNQSLDLAKEGDISIELIMKIHRMFIQTYSNLKKPESVQKHIRITEVFLKSSNDKEINSKHLLNKSYLSTAVAYLKLNDLDSANKYFKTVLKNMEDYPDIEFLYYFHRAKYYQMANFPNKQIAALQRALSITSHSEKVSLEVLYDLALVYFSEKNDDKKALSLIEKAEDLDIELNYDNINLKIDLLELKKEIYRQKQESDKEHEIAIKLKDLKAHVLNL